MVFLALVSLGCGDAPISPPPPPPQPVVARVVISGDSSPVLITYVRQFTAEAQEASGAPITGRRITWTSSNTEVARVDSSGLVIAAGRGQTSIGARVDGVANSVQITVRDPLVSIEIDRRFPSVFPADTILLRATGIDSGGQQIPLPRPRWESALTSVAAIDQFGVATGVGVGRAVIRVGAGALAAESELAVVPKRVRPNREIAFIHDPGTAGAVQELWITDSALGHRISAPGRGVHSFAWSPDGRYLGIAYLIIAAAQPPLFELLEVDTGIRSSVAIAASTPGISPDGARVAFSLRVGAEDVVATMALDGSDLRWVDELPGHEVAPSWSPDGRRLAFLSNPGPGEFQVWWMTAAGIFPRRVSSGSFARVPVWSPDGKWLAYDDGARVWIAEPETGTVRSISPLGVLGFPRWSPDARALLYGTGNSVRIVRLDGTVVGEVPSARDTGISYPGVISPDGKKVAVYRADGVGGGYVIVTANLDGSDAVVVSPPYNCWAPAWRP